MPSILWVALLLSLATSFSPTHVSLFTPSVRIATILRYSDGHHFPGEDLDRTRARLEALLAQNDRSCINNQHPWNTDRRNAAMIRDGIIAQADSQHLFLTTAGRRFRELEMELLHSLQDSDDPLEQLVHLWTTERDGAAAADMLYMQQHCSENLALEEGRLLEMTQEYPGWAEPYSRLATLLYYKGPEHALAAAAMAERALQLKPWHFEALQLLVVIHTKRQDFKTAMYYNRMALPKLDAQTNHEHRREWVSRALARAQQMLMQAESTTKAIRRGQHPKIPMAANMALGDFGDSCWE